MGFFAGTLRREVRPVTFGLLLHLGDSFAQHLRCLSRVLRRHDDKHVDLYQHEEVVNILCT